MPNRIKIFAAVAIALIMVILVFALKTLNKIKSLNSENKVTMNTLIPNQPTSTSENNSQIANLASVYCIDNGGKLEIRTAPDGSQTGYCILPSGTECEEWAYFRKECR